MRTLIVDGMNVIGSRPDGWWRDRDHAVRVLLARLQRLHAATGQPVQVVFDGWPLPDVPEGEHDGVLVRYARRPGADAADDRIAQLLAGEDDPAAFLVVTADRALGDRVRALGGSLERPGALLDRLDRLEATGET
jgi:predicted RNA-binding protein with PIN domain